MDTKLDDMIENSEWRMDAVKERWNAVKGRYESIVLGLGRHDCELVIASVDEEELKGWVTEYPTMNVCMHFACIRDPKT